MNIGQGLVPCTLSTAAFGLKAPGVSILKINDVWDA